MAGEAIDPVFQYETNLYRPQQVGLPPLPDSKWYFWTETWADAIGPYATEAEAQAKCIEYAKQL